MHAGWSDRRVRQVRDLSCGDMRIYLEVEVRRVQCRSCAGVKREQLVAREPEVAALEAL